MIRRLIGAVTWGMASYWLWARSRGTCWSKALAFGAPVLALLTVLVIAVQSRGTAGPSSAVTPAPAKVTVYRDTYGVPHIYGDTAEAAAYGLGYVQAQDHLESMRMKYYQASGQMAAHGLGSASSDSLSHLLRVPQTAQVNYARLPPASRAYIDAFVAGINLYIDEQRASLPAWIDRVEPWEPLAWMHSIQIREQAQIASQEIPAGASPAVSLPGGDTTSASNWWVVAPSRSALGVAILHGDPHLGFVGPLQWYEIHLNYPGVNVAGVLPFGYVGVVMGSSDNLAWTMTNNGIDTADVYAERLNPANPNQYWYEGAWRDMTIQEVAINGIPFIHRYTRHGPVLAVSGNTAYAARMSTFEMVDDPIALLKGWASAATVEVFRNPTQVPALAKWNIVAADRAGNIFYLYNGRVARKSEAFNWGRPVDGTTSATEWGPFLTVGELPSSLNPARGYLQNANNPPWNTAGELNPADYPAYLAPGFGLNDRGTRAVELLEADLSITVADMKTMGMDDLSISGRNVAPLLTQTWVERQKTTSDPDGSLAHAMTLIGAWDYAANVESHAYAVFRLWFESYLESGPSFRAPTAPSFVDLSAADKDKMIQALQSATVEMKGKFGTVDKRWGDVHVIQRGPDFGVGGGNGLLPTLRMVNVDGFSADAGAWTAQSGSSYLFVVAFTDPIEFWSIRPLGQSESPESRHYNDQTALYAQNQYKRMWVTLRDVQSNRESSLTLSYAGLPNGGDSRSTRQ